MAARLLAASVLGKYLFVTHRVSLRVEKGESRWDGEMEATRRNLLKKYPTTNKHTQKMLL